MRSFRVNIKHYEKMLTLCQTPVIPQCENSRSLSPKEVRTEPKPISYLGIVNIRTSWYQKGGLSPSLWVFFWDLRCLEKGPSVFSCDPREERLKEKKVIWVAGNL